VAGATAAANPVTPTLREQRTQSAGAEAVVALGSTLPVPILSARTPLTTATTTTTTTTRELLATTTNAQTTAVETKSRFFKFATARAAASIQAETATQTRTADATTAALASALTSATPRQLTPHRRPLNAPADTDAAYETPSDEVQYDEQPDEVDYNTR
jgi:hypothetical protein